ncbi:AAA family ATPase [Actinoplanes utahensis]|uniref:ATPase AAA n=1 Tax=Actinoplanes utahensis TaxID=1869 RepID=A0A0A6UAG3_ACTUT|nr:MoxR family ATPase [Actinoplanes utahensis]KHD72053.1 ATPase AAA [Actinoplanes utahensis]
MNTWRIYQGDGRPHDGIHRLPPPPNWRSFDGGPPLPTPPDRSIGARRRLGVNAASAAARQGVIDMVNAALYLRRPLLVTGKPGVGKSSLAYQVAHELRLGPVLNWPISSRSTLRDGLYEYDPIGRLRDENIRQSAAGRRRQAAPDDESAIGDYLTLGPLGTALLPFERPRVLLVDEIDKSDVDLPNDLLNVLEDGEYQITELRRLAGRQPEVEVQTCDQDGRTTVRDGRVQCLAFPFIVLTSNDEREFPPAFLRRCLRVTLAEPDAAQLSAMIAAHLGDDAAARARDLIEEFVARRTGSGSFATDQLLSAVYLRYSSADPDRDSDMLAAVSEHVLRDLNAPGPA